MIRDLAQWFLDHEFFWSLKNGVQRIPDEDDIQAALDEAARVLYDEPVGTQLEVGRLIVRKSERSHDVYVHAGTYE